MADEKKSKSNFRGYLTCGLITFAATYGLMLYEVNSSDNSNNKILTGKVIYLDDDAVVYNNLTDMVNCTNGKNGYYDTCYERLVISTFYQVDGNFVRVDMIGNYKEKEQQIIDNNGFVVGVITTVDFENKTPEAYYNISDLKIKGKTKQISMN